MTPVIDKGGLKRLYINDAKVAREFVFEHRTVVVGDRGLVPDIGVNTN